MVKETKQYGRFRSETQYDKNTIRPCNRFVYQELSESLKL
jgi:hypothetical protein